VIVVRAGERSGLPNRAPITWAGRQQGAQRHFLAFLGTGRSVLAMRGLNLLIPTVALLGACTLANMTPQARFSESAYMLNDYARWGQVDHAVVHVSPKYMERFTSRRQEWGERVSIADADLVSMKLAPDHESAVSEVKLSWYDESGVFVHSSVVTQKWASEKGKYKLIDETVRRGDTSVFTEPPPKAEQGG
jgi:hypothetical protein